MWNRLTLKIIILMKKLRNMDFYLNEDPLNPTDLDDGEDEDGMTRPGGPVIIPPRPPKDPTV